MSEPFWTAQIDQAGAAVRDMRADKPGAHEELRCVAPPTGCGQPLPSSLPTAFRDRASRSEYDLTGLCQACQDVVFAPSAEEVAAMAADEHNYGRCGVCGEYRAYEFVDVGVGVIKGFGCCPDDAYRQPQCSTENESDRQCQLRQLHVHGHDFPDWPLPQAGVE